MLKATSDICIRNSSTCSHRLLKSYVWNVAYVNNLEKWIDYIMFYLFRLTKNLSILIDQAICVFKLSDQKAESVCQLRDRMDTDA